MTELVVAFGRTFDLGLCRVHINSTTVKAYGAYPGKTNSGFELKRGHSKDRCPDLKELLFSLSLSADGAVAVHHKAYPGNRTRENEGIAPQVEYWSCPLPSSEQSHAWSVRCA